MAITLRGAPTSGNVTNTVITITLPTYQLTDYIVLIVSSNNGNAQTFSANVTASSIANSSNRLSAWRIVPQDGSQTSFTLTVGASSVFTWWVGSYLNVDIVAPVLGVGNNIGNSTTAPIEVPVVPLSYITTGNELVISAGSVNATATWTTTGSTIFNTTSGNAALMINADTATANILTLTPATLDRGLGGTSRNESALGLVLQEAPIGIVNLLTNPSFEDAAGTSTGWETEGNTIGTPAYTKLSTGAFDGARRQQMQYAGQAGDTDKFFAIYQAPIAMTPGQLLTFTIYLSGSKTAASLIIGIEGFSTGMVYISESDTNVASLTGTMTQYSVSYATPVDTVAVAVYIQANELAPTTSITVQMDRAVLTVAPAVTATPYTLSLATMSFAPTILLPQGISPSQLALSISTFAPRVNLSVTPNKTNLTLAWFSPTISLSDNIIATPDTLALSISAFSPGSVLGYISTPGILELLISTFELTVVATTDTYLFPPTEVLTLTTYRPKVTYSVVARSHYIDTDGNIYWVINQGIGLIEKI